jgi:hypothetical protein
MNEREILMVKKLHIVMLFFAVAMVWDAGLQAQKKQTAIKDNLQQQKISFFTGKLQLTPDESAKFWPVYNDYQNRRDKITRDRNTLLQYYEANKANMTEAEASEIIVKYIAFQQEETRLLESYTTKFQEFLPAKKVIRIYIVELDFKKWLLENLRQNKMQASPRN